MRLRLALVLALLGSTTAAVAQDDSGATHYAGLRGSLAFDGSLNEKDSTPSTTKITLGAGGGGSVFWGLHLPAGFDTELELLYRYVPLGNGSVDGLPAKFGGYGQMFAPMANLYWTPALDLPVKPYIGAGIGYAWNEIGINSIAGTSFPTIHDDNWRLAYNGMAGIAIPTSDITRFTVGYRYLHEGVNCSVAGTTCHGNLNSSSIDIGYTIDF